MQSEVIYLTREGDKVNYSYDHVATGHGTRHCTTCTVLLCAWYFSPFLPLLQLGDGYILLVAGEAGGGARLLLA